MTSHRFACLVPAHNEAARIESVLTALVGHPQLDQVLVVDDGSTDHTAEVALACGATVLRLVQNGGKTAAVARGLAQLNARHIVLIDADLLGLTAQDITRLIAPVASGQADATMSLRGNAPLLWRMLGVDYISGERVIPASLIRPHLETLHTLPRFGFEVFLNQLLRDKSQRVSVVRWPDVASPSKAAKRGVWRGLRADVSMMADLLRVGSTRFLARQIYWLHRNHRQTAQGVTKHSLGSPL